MEISRQFKSVRKNGYDPAEVRRAFREADGRLNDLTNSIASGQATLEKLERELTDLRETLRRSNEKPTFADLGSAFEQTLRIAEEQADKIVKDAEADAKVVRESARAHVEEVTRIARNRASEMLGSTEAKIEENRLEVERQVAELTMIAESKVLQAQTMTETAQRRTSALAAEAERDAAEVRGRIHQEVEDVRTELDTLRQISEREQFRIEREVKLALEEAEGNRLQRHEDAVATVEGQQAALTQLISDTTYQIDSLTADSEAFMSKARADVDTLLRSAREAATALINRTRSRAESLTVNFDEHANDMLTRLQRQRDELERQRDAMRTFALELKALSSADSMVSLDESDAQRD